MTVLRRHLRLWALTWLILQANALAAFVPRDCCAAHRPAVEARPCHDTAAPAHCPMRDVAGRPCPMHRGNASATHGDHAKPAAHDHATAHTAPDATEAQHTPARDCVMRGTCHGQTFVSVLSFPGILPDLMPEPVPAGMPASVTDLRQQTLAGVVAPDPHPPRA